VIFHCIDGCALIGSEANHLFDSVLVIRVLGRVKGSSEEVIRDLECPRLHRIRVQSDNRVV